MDNQLRICVAKLKVVFIFGGDLIRADPGPNGLGWRSLVGTEADKTGGMPSYERVLAGAALWRMNNKLILVPSGGESNIPGQTGNTPPISTVMSIELQELGVPKENIIEEPLSFVSTEHVPNCAAIARAHKWESYELGILSIFIHLARIAAMLRMEQEGWVDGSPGYPLSSGDNDVPLLSAERVLAAEDPSWNEKFAKLYADPQMIPTLVGEALGAGQLWGGHQPKWPRPFRGFKDPLATWNETIA